MSKQEGKKSRPSPEKRSKEYSIFKKAVAVVLAHEGGLVDNPNDPGGLTKYGISQRSYPNVDIRNLSRERAEEIYYRDFWQSHSYHLIRSPRIATKVFDLAVNCGPKKAHVLLQRALRARGFCDIVDDGMLGPMTISAANSRKARIGLLFALRAEAAGHYRLLAARNPKLEVFLKGWLRRAYDDGPHNARKCNKVDGSSGIGSGYVPPSQCGQDTEQSVC